MLPSPPLPKKTILSTIELPRQAERWNYNLNYDRLRPATIRSATLTKTFSVVRVHQSSQDSGSSKRLQPTPRGPAIETAPAPQQTLQFDREKTISSARSIALERPAPRSQNHFEETSVTEKDNKTGVPPEKNDRQVSALPAYEPPRLTVMDENQVMSVFQVPVVAGSWWG